MLPAPINLTPISDSDTDLYITISKSSLIACHSCFHLSFSVPTLCNLQPSFLSVPTSSHFPFYLIRSHWEQKPLNLLNPSQFNFSMAAALWATAKQDSRQDPKIMGTPRRFSNLALPPGLEEQMPGYSVELGDRRQALRLLQLDENPLYKWGSR